MLFYNLKENYPTHLIIGVRKSGTSWIWKQLSDHPEVYVNPKKEIYFFNKNYYKGKSWYKNQFVTNKKIIIDTTPDYFYWNCAKRIKDVLPNSNLIVCLRNPIDRAYSHWKFGTYIGNCKKNFLESWSEDWNNIRTCGLYEIHLKNFLKYYEVDKNFKILLFDDLLKNSNHFINEIYQFINIKKHKSKFFNRKWMPGAVSDYNLEELYQNISNKKIKDTDKEVLKNYYSNTIKDLKLILNKEINW
jgi:hypothetical protein